MSYDNIENKQCSVKGCDRSFKNHRWGQIKAHGDGWFVQKNGTAYCPDHTPEWVKGWRKKNER